MKRKSNVLFFLKLNDNKNNLKKNMISRVDDLRKKAFKQLISRGSG